MDEHLKDLRMSEWLTPQMEIGPSAKVFINGSFVGETVAKPDPQWPDAVLEDILDAEYITDEK